MFVPFLSAMAGGMLLSVMFSIITIGVVTTSDVYKPSTWSDGTCLPPQAEKNEAYSFPWALYPFLHRGHA